MEMPGHHKITFPHVSFSFLCLVEVIPLKLCRFDALSQTVRQNVMIYNLCIGLRSNKVLMIILKVIFCLKFYVFITFFSLVLA